MKKITKMEKEKKNNKKKKKTNKQKKVPTCQEPLPTFRYSSARRGTTRSPTSMAVTLLPTCKKADDSSFNRLSFQRLEHLTLHVASLTQVSKKTYQV
jgi:hypothetical protein